MLRIPCGATHANGESSMWDSCAVVGNGGHLLLSAYAPPCEFAFPPASCPAASHRILSGTPQTAGV
jgi:hypothetical protein